MRTQKPEGGWQMDDPISTVLLVFFIVIVFLLPWKSCNSGKQHAQANANAPATNAPAQPANTQK